MIIRPFAESDFDRVQTIYKDGIDTGNATFQLSKKDWQQWQNSMIEDSLLVISDDPQQLKGWAGLSLVSARPVYSGVGEVSIYVAKQAAGLGVGSQLMSALIDCSESLGFWTLQAAIFPENKASLALHVKHGFTEIGQRKKLGKLHGVWRDVVLLERRSTVIGQN